jgi:hypothetical protein
LLAVTTPLTALMVVLWLGPAGIVGGVALIAVTLQLRPRWPQGGMTEA